MNLKTFPTKIRIASEFYKASLATTPCTYRLSSFCGWVTRDYETPWLKQELEDWDSPIALLPPEENKLARYYWLNFFSLHNDGRRRSTLNKTRTRLSEAIAKLGYEFAEIEAVPFKGM